MIEEFHNQQSEPEQSGISPSDEDYVPSKSRLKRERQQLNELARELCQLPEKQFSGLHMNEDLLSALKLCRAIRSHSARKRQLQYAGKLISRLSADEREEIHNQLQMINHQAVIANKQFHLLERIRDDLLHQGDEQIQQLISRYPRLDRQHLRQLVRSASKEHENGKPPKHARRLFKYLREMID